MATPLNPVNPAKVIITLHARSGLWQLQNTTVQIHRNATLEEYSIPTPEDIFESEDFELVKTHAFQNALAWIDAEEGLESFSGKVEVEVHIAE